MKFFTCAVVIALIATISQKTLAAPALSESAAAAVVANAEDDDLEPSASVDGSLENTRFRKAAPPAQSGKSAYGSAVPVAYGPAPAAGPALSYSYQVPAPTVPCARNLLFSCQPSVAPVPCAAPAPLYASAPVAPASAPVPTQVGAYSEPVPQWAVPAFQQQYGMVPTVREVMYGY